MFETIWTAMRYHLPSHSKSALDSAIKSWVAQQEARTIGHLKLDVKMSMTYTAYSIVCRGRPLWRQTSALAIYYRAPILYVFAHDLPPALEGIYEAVIAPYVLRQGGKPLEDKPRTFETSQLTLSLLEDFESLAKREMPAPASLSQEKVTVHLNPELERVQVATEELNVPLGVTVKVKRSRTVEHTVDVTWRLSGGGNVEAGLRQIVTASVRGEIERVKGCAYQQSETVEYEVELSGDRSDRYKLIWTDVWRKGTVQFQQGGTTQVSPFRFRERAELEVISIETTNSG
jgi:hypothetical protein